MLTKVVELYSQKKEEPVMASENETVAEIVSEMRIFKCRNLASGELENCVTTQHYFADRIEAAHRREVETARIAECSAQACFDEELASHDREVAELHGERNGILKANASLAADNDRLRREVAELKNKCEEYERQPELMAETAKAALELPKAQESKIAELRECLQEAINNECNYCRTVRSDGTYGKCEHLRADGECDHLRDVKCIVHKWRKALEGANHDNA